MAQKVSSSLQNWKFQDQHVSQNLAGGDFIGSHSCIICATGPRLADIANNGGAFVSGPEGVEDLESSFAIPIGVIDSASIQQSRQMAQIFEIGSKRSYLMASRTVGMMNVARVMYKGPNLLRMLYAFYPESKIDFSTGEQSNVLSELQKDQTTALGPEPISLDSSFKENLPDIKDLPGYNNVFLNMNSDLFSQPYGIVLYMKDNHDQDVAAVYLEECYIENHAFSISANALILAENVTMRFERIVPIKVKVVRKKGAVTSSDVTNYLK